MRLNHLLGTQLGDIVSQHLLLAKLCTGFLLHHLMHLSSSSCILVSLALLHRLGKAARASGNTSIHEQGCSCCNKAGFVISSEYPFNGTSPDGYVYDPVATEQYGLVEIKCPYKFRNQTPEDAASDKNFYCALVNEKVVLITNHNYYCQVQGQMAITKRSWCDFVVYTTCGISIERIRFDLDFWSRTMLPRLVDFYDNCLCPAIVSPIHLVGMKMHDLRMQV